MQVNVGATVTVASGAEAPPAPALLAPAPAFPAPPEIILLMLMEELDAPDMADVELRDALPGCKEPWPSVAVDEDPLDGTERALDGELVIVAETELTMSALESMLAEALADALIDELTALLTGALGACTAGSTTTASLGASAAELYRLRRPKELR